MALFYAYDIWKQWKNKSILEVHASISGKIYLHRGYVRIHILGKGDDLGFDKGASGIL